MAECFIHPIKQLLQTPTLPALGPGPRAGVLSESELNERLESCFRGGNWSAAQRELIRALLLLWHDYLAAAHTIAQGIENANGSYVHAIVHRREPDYWNAKYWWRRVGAHPVFPALARRVEARFAAPEAMDLVGQLLPGGHWDAVAFVDACEAVAGGAAHESWLREVQRMETEVLLESLLPNS